jgi:hypothetical protein
MAENIPGAPGGAFPPKPPEPSKIQPKKETVRINLPPKPSAAPTIKLPTLPAGGPTASGAQFSAPPSPVPAITPARSAAAPTATGAAAQRAPAPRSAAPAPRPAAISGLDKALAIAAAIAALAAVGTTIWMTFLFTPQ